MRRVFWHLMKASLACGFIYLFSAVTTIGVSLGADSKMLQIPDIVFYIMAPLLSLVTMSTAVSSLAQGDFKRCIEYYNFPITERQAGIPLWKSLANPYVLLETGVALVLFSSLPLNLGLQTLREYLTGIWTVTPALEKIIFVACQVFFFYLFDALAYHKVYKMWLHNIVPKEWIPFLPQTIEEKGEPEEEMPATFFLKKFLKLGFYLGIYWVCGIAAPACAVMLFGVGYVLVKFYFIPLAILGLIAFLILLAYIRAFKKRRQFMKRLVRVCDENGYVLSKEIHPYRTLFFGAVKESFSVTVKGTTYSCCLVGSTRRRATLFFGKHYILHRHEFRIYGRPILKFGFCKTLCLREGDVKTIFIVLPDALNMFVADEVGTQKINVGSKIFNYQIYGDDDFLGNLTRNSLMR